ncbi:MAG: pseudouridine synthase [Bacillota bacterium]|nr:pseudouridine synthase [Bacillota bacterium]
MRLDRLLSNSTHLSRKQAKDALKSSRVSVNWVTVSSPEMQVTDNDKVCLDGQELAQKTEHHLMLNKPAGLLTAARDSRAKTVMDLLPPLMAKVKCMPIGRLDKDTEGLLLFTTDGELAHRLLSPKREIEKTYEARVEGRLTQKDVSAFEAGIELSDFTAKPAKMQILSAGEKESLALAIVTEGKFHQVKRMFGSLGHEVLALKRLKFGPLDLDASLAIGQYRELSEDEVRKLKEAVGLV